MPEKLPYEALSIEREGNDIHIEIEIPNDSAQGFLLDCPLEFKRDDKLRVVFKSNDAFRIVEEEAP